jgi:hypothetical protein
MRRLTARGLEWRRAGSDKEQNMRKATLALAVVGVMLGTGAVSAKGKSLTGIWTMTVEQHFGLRLELAQDKNALTGRLDWPHGDPIKLVGAVKGDTVTFSGDSSGENFTVHVDSTGSLKADGTMAGTLKALFVDLHEAHEVVRKHDQEIPWTAERGEHGIVHFGR